MASRWFRIVVIAFILLLPQQVLTEIDRGCLKENIMNKDYSQRVTLIILDTTTITGRLLKIDFDRALLTVQNSDRAEGYLSTYKFDSLVTVKFYKRGKIEGEWILAGFLGGALLGAGISAADQKSGTLSRNVQYWGGFIGGGLAGLFLGLILPPMFNSRTIECGSVKTGET